MKLTRILKGHVWRKIALLLNVQVHIQLLDDQGHIVAMDSGYADQKCIPPGATSVFKLFTPHRPGVAQIRIGYVAWQWSSE